MSKYQHIKQEAYEANMQLPKLGLVLFTFGGLTGLFLGSISTIYAEVGNPAGIGRMRFST